MMNKEEYIEYYKKHNRCIDDSFGRNKSLNDKQLDSRYEKYIRREAHKQEKLANKEYKPKEIKIDEQWEEIKLKLSKECLLTKRLKEAHFDKELILLKNNASFLYNIIDGAHCFSRSRYPHMKYMIDNVVPLNRYSHSMLDQYRSPIDGKPITKEEHDQFWKFILGIEKYNKLEEISLKH